MHQTRYVISRRLLIFKSEYHLANIFVFVLNATLWSNIFQHVQVLEILNQLLSDKEIMVKLPETLAEQFHLCDLFLLQSDLQQLRKIQIPLVKVYFQPPGCLTNLLPLKLTIYFQDLHVLPNG